MDSFQNDCQGRLSQGVTGSVLPSEMPDHRSPQFLWNNPHILQNGGSRPESAFQMALTLREAFPPSYLSSLFVTDIQTVCPGSTFFNSDLSVLCTLSIPFPGYSTLSITPSRICPFFIIRLRLPFCSLFRCDWFPCTPELYMF